jgi:hypothetical protein
MADPLLFAAYAAAKWLQKGRRDEAAVAAELKKQQEAEAKATAEARVTPYGRKTPTGPIQQLNMLDKNFGDYTVTHRRFGTGEIKEVAPDEQTFPLFQLPDGTRGTKSDLEKSVVNRVGQFGTWDDLKAKQIGARTVKGKTYKDDYAPDTILKGPEKPKNVFVFEGSTEDGTQVFGRTAQEVRQKGGVDGSIGQKSVTPDVATALGFGDSVLSTTQKSFIPAAAKEDPKKSMRYVGEMEDGRIVYADTAAELNDQGAVRVGESEFTVQDDKPIRTGKISWLTPTETDTKETKQFATVYQLDENGERVDDKQVDVPLWKYREGTNKYELVTAYQKDETGQRSSIDVGQKSASAAKGAMDVAASPFDIKYRDTDNKEQMFYVPKEFKAPNQQLDVFRNWMSKLPSKNGSIDWTAANLNTPEKMKRIQNYAVNLIQQNTTVKDPISGEMVPSKDLLVDEIAFLRNNFPVLSQIPDLEAAVKVRAGLQAAEVVAQITRENSIAPDGSAQSVIVAQTPVEVPANVVDPAANPNDPPLAAKLNLAIPFDPKYNETVDFVMSALAPSGTEAEIAAAKNSFKSLVNFEYDDAGRVKKSPQGQVIISKVQPKLDFLSYLTKTKDADSTPFFASWQNMLKLGAERKVTNPAVEADIKLAFNNAFDGDFESGMALISAFSPPVTGTKRDRMLFAAQSGKNSQMFARERNARVTQAESASTAIRVIDKMIQTYYTNDGQFIDINTTLGQFYVSADGAVHMFQQGMENVLPGLLPVSQDQAVAAAQNTIFGKDNNGKPTFLSIVDNQLPAADMLEIAKERGYKTVDAFLEAERTARKENIDSFQKSVAGLGSNDEKVKNLALRNYYRFMVAYSMAAAIQGGTGGRTISDQDVQNILRALKMDSFFGQASTEVEILTAAKEMLVSIEQHSRAVGDGGQRAYAALKLQELSMGNVGTKINIDNVTEMLEQPGGSGQPTKDDVAAAAMTDAEKLEKINAAQGKFGDTYTTIEEATAALGATGVARILTP